MWFTASKQPNNHTRVAKNRQGRAHRNVLLLIYVVEFKIRAIGKIFLFSYSFETHNFDDINTRCDKSDY